MSKLYELGEQYRVFNNFVDSAWDNDDLTEDDLQLYIETLESIEDEISNKAENIAKFMKNIEGDIKALKEEEDRLAKKRKYLQNKIEGLKSYTQAVLEVNKIDKIDAGLFKVRLQKNPPSINIVNERAIPNTYRIPQPDKIDTKGLLAAVKQGKVVEGVELVTDKKHLRIS
ncbi:siphovirus Gp157 family protein [Paenibacillus polymyxa]|uniref:Siphovirus Gp157 n=1 Tax=Paenibacillus polymyxa TaxID=1406 RepID=A0A378Y131_PAEPO|nr:MULTISPECIES: siphovirus Gp157 family protein [Paenibacillus]KAF6620527.1 siphovirus Gp157 family protein [Paenibacillus sp. EKM101P]KAF6623519.1 siphovirus Gp157 family protein [Paenibacillus sp. EKM102P]KAF6633917.1 siphovirus Gp157 family protein [Paenibacillus sp. EKM10P]KAF6649445.1 siphovirus Gp157 family protein [Paenibacillus sp. EKM11P]MBE7896155.1 siphovirus Gp157 family protein [Paenibacillus polymyxa]